MFLVTGSEPKFSVTKGIRTNHRTCIRLPSLKTGTEYGLETSDGNTTNNSSLTTRRYASGLGSQRAPTQNIMHYGCGCVSVHGAWRWVLQDRQCVHIELNSGTDERIDCIGAVCTTIVGFEQMCEGLQNSPHVHYCVHANTFNNVYVRTLRYLSNGPQTRAI